MDSGSQCILCDLPINHDTYKGCSHDCLYCFARARGVINDVAPKNEIGQLEKFIAGQRTKTTSWIDWDIPIHIGGMSDPFQPCERQYRQTYKTLQLLAKTNYPFVISTKGKLVADDEYLEILEKCNCVVQISAVCSKYDELEKGAPSFDERMEMIRKIAPRVKRVVVRVQPFMHEVLEDVYKNLEVFKNVGAYGVIIEGLKHRRKKAGMVKVGGDYCYPYDIMLADFLKLREKAHKIGLKIYAGENRIRTYGDSMACCGIDGLEGFRGNEYNLTHILNGKKTQPTERQKEKGTAMVFCSLIQRKANSEKYKHLSFAEAMVVYYEDKKNWLNDVFGITKK